MYNIKNRCKSVTRKPRHRVTVALDGDLWERFQPVFKERWEGSFTTWLEFALECYSRDTCKDCPYEPDDDDQEKATDGIGKVLDKES